MPIGVHIVVHVQVYRYVHIHAHSAPHVHTRSSVQATASKANPDFSHLLSQQNMRNNINKLAEDCMNRLSLLTSAGFNFGWFEVSVENGNECGWTDERYVCYLLRMMDVFFCHVTCFCVILILYLRSRLIETSGEIRHCYIYVQIVFYISVDVRKLTLGSLCMFFDTKPIIKLPFSLLILKTNRGRESKENMTSINIGFTQFKDYATSVPFLPPSFIV